MSTVLTPLAHLDERVFHSMLVEHIVDLQQYATATRTRAATYGEHDRSRFTLECMAAEREFAAASLRYILLLTAPQIIAGKAV